MDNLFVFKLVTGEEVIGELLNIDLTNGYYEVKEPRVFFVTRDPTTGQPVFDLGPVVYSTLNPQEVRIRLDAVVFKIKGLAEPVQDVYLRATGQKVLDVVTNKIITP